MHHISCWNFRAPVSPCHGVTATPASCDADSRSMANSTSGQAPTCKRLANKEATIQQQPKAANLGVAKLHDAGNGPPAQVRRHHPEQVPLQEGAQQGQHIGVLLRPHNLRLLDDRVLREWAAASQLSRREARSFAGMATCSRLQQDRATTSSWVRVPFEGHSRQFQHAGQLQHPLVHIPVLFL